MPRLGHCSAGSPCPAIVRRLKDSEARRPRATMGNGMFAKTFTHPPKSKYLILREIISIINETYTVD